MRVKNFEEMKSIDDEIKQAMRDANGGRPPDNFIEDVQGGGVDAALVAAESPSEEQALVDGLKEQLTKRHPGAKIQEEGSLRYD